MDTFLGKPVEYWMELNKQPQTLNVEDLIQEIAELRGKVSFYESRIEIMNKFMNKSSA